MKKNIFYFLMMACMVLISAACSNDDGDALPDYTAKLNEPQYAAEAMALTGLNISPEGASAPKLTGIHFTESGEVVIELDNGEEYIVSSIESVEDGTYTLAGNQGSVTVTINGTLSSNSKAAKMTIDLSIRTSDMSPNDPPLRYQATNVNVTSTTGSDNSEAMNNLCRTWIVQGMVIDLKGDVTAFREFDGGNLYELATYANEKGAELNSDEMEELDRNIQSVIIEKTGLMTFNYSNRTPDAAAWSWKNDGTIKLTLKNSEMGNKYLNDNTIISVTYKDNRCVLRLNTSITDGKNYDAVLTFRLISKD